MKTTPVLPETQMRALGFTDHRQGHWYFVTRVAAHTTLNISINKETGEYTEDVLNEFFLQPEYYGRMIEPYRSGIRERIESHLDTFAAAGLSIAVDHRGYGWEGRG